MAAFDKPKMPNLKICIDNFQSDDESKNLEDEDAGEEMSINDDGDEEMNDCEDLLTRDKRAERFGTDLREDSHSPIEDSQLNSLYQSLGVERREATSSGSRWGKYRFNAIHVRGVSDMSTEDILDYFKDFGSPAVEWINDISCNVVWLQADEAIKAMLALSKAILNDVSKNSSETTDTKEALIGNNTEDLVMFTEEDNEETEELPQDDEKTKEPAEATKDSISINDLSIPVPPGLWRYGIPHTKSKAIVMRFATKSDRKLPGAEKRSEYYLKYGNPNYGGMKGIISTSRKRKYRESSKIKEPYVVEKKSSSTEGDEEAKPFDLFSSQIFSENELKKTKKLRMKMYADEEVKKPQRKSESEASFSPKTDLRSRLEAHRERQNNNSQSTQSRKEGRHSPSGVDLRTKLRNKPFNRSESTSREASDDLRDKLDLIRQKKKFQHRSPLVIHILEEAKST